MSDNKTTFDSKASILADFWLSYKNDEQFQDLFSYADLGFPLAYAYANEIATILPIGNSFIEETFDLLLEATGREDEGFEALDDFLLS